MPASFTPLRILLGSLCAFFAYYLGRIIAARLEARATNAQVMRWSLRVLATALGTAWGASLISALLFLGLAVLSAGAGFFTGMRPRKPEEDLARRMFPQD